MSSNLGYESEKVLEDNLIKQFLTVNNSVDGAHIITE